MADIKKFTGYISSDGKTHNSQSAAVAHERDLKTKKALAEAFDETTVYGGKAAVATQLLADFLFANREVVLAALNQEVLLRKKRASKAKVSASGSPRVAAVKAEAAPQASRTPEVQLQDGIFDADS